MQLSKGLGGGWESYQDLPPSYTPEFAIITALRGVLRLDDPLK